MKLFAKLSSALIVLAALAVPSLSNAALVFTITRISDSQAQITGSGTLDGPVGNSFLSFADATSLGDSGTDPFTGSMSIGGVGVEYVYARVDGTNFVLDFFNSLAAGGSVTGSLLVTLDVETWNPIGTTGTISEEGNAFSLGTYSIVGATSQVPEPGSLALLGLGLVGLAAARKRKQT